MVGKGFIPEKLGEPKKTTQFLKNAQNPQLTKGFSRVQTHTCGLHRDSVHFLGWMPVTPMDPSASRFQLLVTRQRFAHTPSKFNIAPEKRWLEDYFPIGKVSFQGLC